MRTGSIALFALALPSLAAARPMGFLPSPDEQAVDALGREVAALRLVRALEPTEAQRRELTRLATVSVDEIAAIRKAREAARPADAQAMQALRAGVLAGQVPEAVKHAVGVAEKPAHELEQAHDKATRERVPAVWALLTPAQVAALRRPAGDNVDPALPLHRVAAQLPRKGDLDGALAALYKQWGLRGAEVDRAVAFGRPIVAAWRTLSPTEAAARRLEVARRLVALPPGVTEPKPEQPLGQAIERTLLADEGLRAMAPKVRRPALPPGDDPPSLRTTITDIQVMNLVNTLYLTTDQMRALTKLGAEARDEWSAIAAAQADLAHRARPVLERMRARLRRGQPLEPALLAQSDRFDRERREIGKQEEELEASYLAAVRPLATANQVQMVSTFSPCTVPNASITNPERVGQINDPSGIEQALRKLRTLPPDKAAAETEALRKRIEADLVHRKLPDEEVARYAGRVAEVAGKARALDDAAFKVEARGLAVSLGPPDHVAEGKELDRRLVAYLLSPNLPPILAERLAGAGAIAVGGAR